MRVSAKAGTLDYQIEIISTPNGTRSKAGEL
jgi:hypothetical protein